MRRHFFSCIFPFPKKDGGYQPDVPFPCKKLQVEFLDVKKLTYANVLFTVFCCAYFRILTAQTPAIIKDIYNYTNVGSIMDAANFTAVGDIVYFTAVDCINGFGLWKTDYTAVGTVMVKDTRQGQESSLRENLVNGNGTLFFQL